MSDKSQINVRVDVELRERLEVLARTEDRTLSGQVRHLLAAAAGRERGDRSDGAAA
jgi:predicted DNA-binding protein